MIRWLCRLKQRKMFLKKSSATPFTLLLHGVRITPFERPWSTMTKSESNPLERGRSVIRSTESCWKGQGQEEGRGDNAGTVGWVLTFICWERVQPAMKQQTNKDIPGHQ